MSDLDQLSDASTSAFPSIVEAWKPSLIERDFTVEMYFEGYQGNDKAQAIRKELIHFAEKVKSIIELD